MTARFAFARLFAGLLLVALAAGPSFAQTGVQTSAPADPLLEAEPAQPMQGEPIGNDREARLDRLFDKLANATSAEDAKRFEGTIDELWGKSGSDTADLLTLRAEELVAGEDQDGALKLLEAALQAKPDYAEGWNKRATLYFLRGDYVSAMSAIRETLRYEPRHYGAWAGLGRILEQTGDNRRALDAYRRALAINPHLDGLKDEVNALVLKIRGEEL
jgi:tetratricopeptide (TPR) repeat protein